jgi:FHS family L-fucose permease-like MFS transporter
VTTARSTTFAVGLITCLFFLWGFALNLNPILIPHLKKACQLTDGQSALIDSASYLAYFLLALPAGQFMKRFGYKGGMLLGLGLFALGALLFYPAAALRSYAFFLGALFVIASGLTFLETAANPYITGLGSPEGATQRLNFAQSFNGLAATLAPLLGGIFILSGKSPSSAQLAALSPAALATYLDHEAAAVQAPYLLIGGFVLLIALLLWRTPLPALAEEEADAKADGSLWQQKNLLFGVLAQFFYVGAQVCVSSFFIRFAGSVAGMDEKLAAQYLAVALFGFMAGRFLGTVLMRFVPAARLLALYSVLNVGLLVLATTLHGTGAVYALLGVEFFMSIMFPTIFSLGIRGLGARTKDGSALLVMSIAGGAVLPVIMGHVSDASTIQTAYLVPALCFLAVLGFALRNSSVRNLTLATAH